MVPSASSLDSWVEMVDARTSILFERLSAFAAWPRYLLNISHGTIDNIPEMTGLPAKVCVKSAFLSRLDGGIRWVSVVALAFRRPWYPTLLPSLCKLVARGRIED